MKIQNDLSYTERAILLKYLKIEVPKKLDTD